VKDLLRTVTICAIISASIAYWMGDDDMNTAMFCAYGRVFVTFRQHHTTWGTLLLDENGAPMPCDEADIKKDAKHKGTII